MQVICKDKIDVLVVQAASSQTSPEVLDIVKRMPTSILVWRDLESRAAQLHTFHVSEAPEEGVERPTKAS
jgi:hypothetical protein